MDPNRTDARDAPPLAPAAVFRFAAPRQERIHRRLQLVGPGAAAFFRDACALMEAETLLLSTTHVRGRTE